MMEENSKNPENFSVFKGLEELKRDCTYKWEPVVKKRTGMCLEYCKKYEMVSRWVQVDRIRVNYITHLLSLKHPTYFNWGYMDGYITLGGTRHFIALFPTMFYNSPQFEAALDMILYRLLLFSESSDTIWYRLFEL